jgi:ABC-type polysaccharide/polyol phosphate transport system ATPase subunit
MAVIEFEHVSKVYRLGATQTSLREVVTHATRKLFGRNGAQPDNQLFWALDDVNFKVEQGEVLGIIGHNGAGKSTILKLLSKVSFPTSGHIRTQGRMAALIELGAGFHPDLSGRENIYLNGTILGLTKQEIASQFSNIVEFAGLERFIDTPIKRYSSGMYVRLAFAVAAHIKADLLLVDEVLSVGDMAFQQKSMAKMNELRDSGTTIIFVSHNLGAVHSFCSRVILLHSGRIAATGNSIDVIKVYEDLEEEGRRLALEKVLAQQAEILSLENDLSTITPARITTVELLNLAGQAVDEFRSTDGVLIRCHYNIPYKVEHPIYTVQVRRRIDSAICFTMYAGDPSRDTLQGQGIFEAYIEQLLLVPGSYVIEMNIHSYNSDRDTINALPKPFVVTGNLPDDDSGIYRPNIKWSFDVAEYQHEWQAYR